LPESPVEAAFLRSLPGDEQGRLCAAIGRDGSQSFPDQNPDRLRVQSFWGAMRRSVFLFFLLAAFGAAAFGAQPLTLAISTESATVSPPYPFRLTLHFLNAGKKTIWLYRPVRDASQMGELRPPPPDVEQPGPRSTGGGSSLEVHLASAKVSTEAEPTSAMVLAPVEMPHPNLIRVEPGGEAEEHVLIHFTPAQAAKGAQKNPLWGLYKLSVTYRARYSNGAQIERLLGVDLWHAEAESNTLQISLQPGEGRGEVTGTVADSDSESAPRMLVSLSDKDERLIGQELSDRDGEFRFDGLPWGLYWVTVRRPSAGEVTAVFQHVVLGPAAPSATVSLMLLPASITEPKQIQHKPVLVKVADQYGRPASGVQLQSIFSNEAVVENMKGRTGSDGVAALELIPGSNFLTLKAPGCAEEERRMDVAAGGGVDAFQFGVNCQKK
jgi:Carboxypeptidase regulatory-like domain